MPTMIFFYFGVAIIMSTHFLGNHSRISVQLISLEIRAMIKIPV